MSWENLDTSRPNSAHYSVMRCVADNTMEALRQMFPEGRADYLNFVLFSTSGVHGTYNTIEEVELSMLKNKVGDDEIGDVTFLIVHPRLVALRFGNVHPENLDDIQFLKTLRASSYAAIASIGKEQA